MEGTGGCIVYISDGNRTLDEEDREFKKTDNLGPIYSENMKLE
jgi:hypothetical protein